LNFGGDFVWVLRKEGKVLSDLYVTKFSVFAVEDVYLSWFGLPPDPRAPKNCPGLSGCLELLEPLLKI
jgi:hypothetical protein